MEQLIGDLLMYSRVVHPERDEANAADLDRSFDKALSMLQDRVQETGATMTRRPSGTVFGEERQLALAFQNLVSNALKYRNESSGPSVEMGGGSQ